jgi:Opacity protein and related surface antigens
MKKIVLSAVALGAFAAPAFAADLPVRATPPIAAAIYDWSGFYIGANGGWGQSHNCWDFLVVGGPFIRDGCRDPSGGVAGGQIGYRWQSSQYVFGLEAQGDWADLSSSQVSLISQRSRPAAKLKA